MSDDVDVQPGTRRLKLWMLFTVVAMIVVGAFVLAWYEKPFGDFLKLLGVVTVLG